MNQSGRANSQMGYAMDGSQYLTFTLSQEEYGVEVLKVQEIKGYSTITPIPNTPAYIRGVINLRGIIVPIIDLRMKFGLEHAEHNKFTVIVVVVLGGRVTGLIVDAVSDVLNIRKSEIQVAPEMCGKVDVSYISGLAQVEDRLVILLDIERVLSGDESMRAPEPLLS